MSDKFHNNYRIPSTRFKNWDYSWNGKYFITLCTAGMENLFGEIKGQKMILSHVGVLVSAFWHEIQNQHQNIVLDTFVVMPNHLHGIVNLKNIFDHKSTKSGRRSDLKIEKLADDDAMKSILQEVDDNYLEYAKDKLISEPKRTPKPGNSNVAILPLTALKIEHTLQGFDPAIIFPSTLTIQEWFREHSHQNAKEQNSISSIIESYKLVVLKHAQRLGYNMDWKEHFYGHLIHNDEELRRIRHYISNNTQNWERDKFYG
ncbi:MAG: hypothetical protein K9H16_12945 [Bacteroidales bacterium]|nr:hypothetical protein [Bacteroidales bacterium]